MRLPYVLAIFDNNLIVADFYPELLVKKRLSCYAVDNTISTSSIPSLLLERTSCEVGHAAGRHWVLSFAHSTGHPYLIKLKLNKKN